MIRTHSSALYKPWIKYLPPDEDVRMCPPLPTNEFYSRIRACSR